MEHYIYIALRREKENDDYDGIKSFREVGKHGEADALARLRDKISTRQGVWRIQRTVNPRCFVKASKILQKGFIDEIIQLDSVDSKWKSILMKSECKADKLWLLDIDTTDMNIINDISSWLDAHGVLVPEFVETPNGRHMVTTAFDPREFNFPDVDIKEDALILIEAVEVK